MRSVEKFEKFLSGIDTSAYREKYSRIKIVELDLPRNIQALKHIYQTYWDSSANYLDYEKFYAKYSTDLKSDLEEFRRKSQFSYETFHRGLPARIYRTWASLLTQIHAGYIAEEIFDAVEMNGELDWQGIDMQVSNGKQIIPIQIKKETLSREERVPRPITKRKKIIINITYDIPRGDPFTLIKKQPSVPFARWQEEWKGKLKRLDNGFIVFLPAMFDKASISKLYSQQL